MTDSLPPPDGHYEGSWSCPISRLIVGRVADSSSGITASWCGLGTNEYLSAKGGVWGGTSPSPDHKMCGGKTRRRGLGHNAEAALRHPAVPAPQRHPSPAADLRSAARALPSSVLCSSLLCQAASRRPSHPGGDNTTADEQKRGRNGCGKGQKG